MKWLLIVVAIAFSVYVGSLQTIGHFGGNSLSALSILSGINPKLTEETILEFYTEHVPVLGEGTLAAHDYTLRTQITDMNGDGRKDLIAILESAHTCGTGGCLGSIFLQDEFQMLKPMDFLYTVKSIEPLDTSTGAMRDLRINEDNSNYMMWNGSTYTLEARE